jgi:hypothetical protein
MLPTPPWRETSLVRSHFGSGGTRTPQGRVGMWAWDPKAGADRWITKATLVRLSSVGVTS